MEKLNLSKMLLIREGTDDGKYPRDGATTTYNDDGSVEKLTIEQIISQAQEAAKASR